MSIEVKNVHKRFGSFTALDNVSLSIPSGELVGLLGPSGSGKTTLLRIIAGLETPDQGSVFLNNEEATTRSVRERGVGFVFQHYALFRHMTVFENVAFGLRVRSREHRPAESEIQRRVTELLTLVQLDWTAKRYPSQLSGGQRQRIALARALAVEPKVLLLDEPFGALDAKVREELRRWLRRLHDELHLTGVFVTHDQEEALEVATQVAVLNEGRIEQAGAPDDLYHRPATPFVSSFLSSVNLFHGRVEEGRVYVHDTPLLVSQQRTQAAAAVIHVRPHGIDVQLKANGKPGITATIKHINAAGPRAKVELITEWGEPIMVEMDHQRLRDLDLTSDIKVFLTPRDEGIFVYDSV